MLYAYITQHILAEHIPSFTTIKHSMDVSHYTASGLSDDDEDEHGDASMRATLPHRTTGQSAEFEFDHIAALGINNSFDKALTEQVMPPMYLYPELTEPCKQAALAKESVYEVDNCLALVRYDVAAADYRIVVGQPVVCLSEVQELDQVGGFSEHEKTGRKQRQKQHFIGPTTTATSTDTGPSFTNFIQPIVDPSDLCILESKNKKSQKHRAKRIKRKTSSLSRRKSHKLAHHRQKQPETVIIEYSVSDNGIKNRNAIICCGKEHVGDDEANSSHYQSPAAHGNQVADSLRSGSWEEANACWEVGKAILQVHDDNHLMTQTIQGLIDNEQEEWLRRKNEEQSKKKMCEEFGCSIALNGRILHVEGTFTRYNLDCLVSFIYAPIDGTLKKELWDYLITFKDSVSTPWCLAGDFNETLSSSDRKGGSKVSAAMSRFKQCIDSCELLDLPLNGKRFTWSRGNAASRIDRIFVSGDWLQLLPASTLFGLPRFSSDHRPLQLLLDYKNWGPKPFRFMNCWWLMADFRKMIQSFWNSISVSSTGRGNMVSAFKMLKERCKHWNKEVVGNMSNQIKELESEADSLDNLKECRDLSADELIRSNVIVSKLRTLYIMQESIWHQKSRVQWCKLGDKNTRFFHLAATIRQKRNLISSLEVDGNMLSKPAEMKIAVFNFFRNLYSHHDRPRPSCYHLQFQKLKPSSSVALECPESSDLFYGLEKRKAGNYAMSAGQQFLSRKG
ncbi:hypothetical protein POTOM_054377 [Populus tomentosa]|uniref:Endonuclease/exonuclease/phosphatase domain-containing protein n=1 Tax=Populus tomentosa TaxID=118781 RepID=A0A8X7XZ27_POPTO|nr:hypothetical protein POTOM_054377 [Populus tomentosa]